MATKTGFQQAAVVYKVRAADGTPLGTDGHPISETGRRQAIALLKGATNPNPALYEVELIFDTRATIDGTDTVTQSSYCLSGYIALAPVPGVTTTLSTAAPTWSGTVTSDSDWTVTAPAGITVSPAFGPVGATPIVISRTGNGQGLVTFTNKRSGETISYFFASVDTIHWVLNPTWDNLGIWQTNGIWIN